VALEANGQSGKPAVNAAVLLDWENCCWSSTSGFCPSTTFFDEQRYFSPARSQRVVGAGWQSAWHLDLRRCLERQAFLAPPPVLHRSMEELMAQHPGCISICHRRPTGTESASCAGRCWRLSRAVDGIPVLLCNQVGGNDSLIFDGSSLAIDGRGDLIAQAASLKKTSCSWTHLRRNPIESPQPDDTRAAWKALVIGRATTCANRFSQGLVALSGASIQRWWSLLQPRLWVPKM